MNAMLEPRMAAAKTQTPAFPQELAGIAPLITASSHGDLPGVAITCSSNSILQEFFGVSKHFYNQLPNRR
jgi:hypothetical protein